MLVAALVTALTLAQSLPSSAGPAAAANFGQSFTATAVGSYVEAGDSLLVAAAGPATPALTQAAAALEAALRGSGRPDLVLNGKSIGEVGELDDPSIVRRCAALPVNHVLVLRVFEAPGKPARAVATLYDKAGGLVTAFSAAAGTALAARGAASTGAVVAAQSPGAGVSAVTARAVLEASTDAPPTPAQQQYDEQYIGFEDWVAVRGYGSLQTIVDRWSDPVLGKYKRSLSYPEFYELVGRQDLADSFRTRRNWRVGLLVGGAAVAIGTPAVALTTANATYGLHSGASTATTVAMIGILGGLAIMSVPVLFINAQPVEAAEVRKLADLYNQKLKVKLGLAQAGSGASRAGSMELAVGTFTARGGGGLLLSGRF